MFKKNGGKSWQNINLKKKGLVGRLYKELLHSIIKCSPELVYNSLLWRGSSTGEVEMLEIFPLVKNEWLVARCPRRLLEGEDRR